MKENRRRNPWTARADTIPDVGCVQATRYNAVQRPHSPINESFKEEGEDYRSRTGFAREEKCGWGDHERWRTLAIVHSLKRSVDRGGDGAPQKLKRERNSKKKKTKKRKINKEQKPTARN